ncbi:Conjugal transfer protein [Poriferisphaera corsica]|uniref:Conjugal transfer protein n=1 Tax=Poriferisphaera corsica TaxID=2528020 RepID=A0A517YSS2_9BACT|nr:TrbG/VirB9 family P-type conjugative transfer protein [Poriferisphaera corsica]QDU33258.1 Conjugal transfer protein [Poriferisphaera corsica]
MRNKITMPTLLFVSAVMMLSGCRTENIQAKKELTRPTSPDLEKVIELEVARRVSDREVMNRDLPEITLPAPQLVPLPEPLAKSGMSQGPSGNGLDGMLQDLGVANKEATRKPAPEGFVNAIQYYDYAPGVRYNVVGAVGYVTAIELERGEEIVSWSAGNTQDFATETTSSGIGGNIKQLLLVKPTKPHMTTNFVITTSRRVYFIDMYANSSSNYQSAIAWNYPLSRLVQHVKRVDGREDVTGSIVSGKFDLDNLNFDYKLYYQERGSDGKKKDAVAPYWAPLRVFDDGAKTYIQFPSSARYMELPPLFVLPTPDSEEAQVVNYRKEGNYYVVDRLLGVAELRLGEAPQTIVKVIREHQLNS